MYYTVLTHSYPTTRSSDLGAVCFQVGKGGLHEMIGRGGSGREGAFPRAVGEAFERRQNRRRCGLPGGAEALRIVDEDIERAEPLDRFGDRSGDLTRIADIAYPPHRFAARDRKSTRLNSSH